MPRSRSIICAIGIDGSGKSTFLDRVAEALPASQTTRIWVRWKPRVSLPLMGLLRILGVTRRIQTAEKPYVDKDFERHPWWGKVWLVLWSIDVALQAIEVRWKLRKAKFVLVDRFSMDLVVDAAADLGKPGWVRSRLARLVLSMFPGPNVVVYLRTDPPRAYERKRDVPSLRYLELRSLGYDELRDVLPVLTLENPSLEEARETARRISAEMQS